MPDLEINRTGTRLTLALNRPKVMNAWTREMVSEMRRVFESVAQSGETRVVVLRGAGENFCAGADINVEKNCTPDDYRAFVSEIQALTNALRKMNAVSIAAIQGYCLGGGMELAVACDLRIAAEDARLGFPEVAIGLTTTSGSTQILPQLVGMARAKELMLTGDWVDAIMAERIGLVNHVVPRAELDAVVAALAAKLSARAPRAVAAQKHLLDDNAVCSLDAALASEVDTIVAVFRSHDGQEGMSAFLEKTRAAL